MADQGAVLVHLSDLHLDGSAEARQRAEAVATAIAALDGVSGVLLTGDVSERGAAEDYRLAAALFGALRVPLIVLPGNHDDRGRFTEYLLRRPGHVARRSVDQVVDLVGLRVVALDSTVPGRASGRLGTAGLELLAEAARGSDRPVAVALHHPPVEVGIPGLDRIGLQDVQELVAVLSRTPQVSTVLCGHVHSAVAAVLPLPCGQEALPVRVAPSVRSRALLPVEAARSGGPVQIAVDERAAPAFAVHLFGPNGPVTHIRWLPSSPSAPPTPPTGAEPPRADHCEER